MSAMRNPTKSTQEEYVILFRSTGKYEDYQEDPLAVFPKEQLEEITDWVIKNNKIIKENNERAIKLLEFIDSTLYFTRIRDSKLPKNEEIIYEERVKLKEKTEESDRRALYEKLKAIYEEPKCQS